MLKDLLAKGFIFAEAPQCFTAKSFAKAISSNLAVLPVDFLPVSSGKKQGKSGNVSSFGRHNLSRVGTLRRTVGMPNPVNFFNLAKIVADDWLAIQAIVDANSLSTSTPPSIVLIPVQ